MDLGPETRGWRRRGSGSLDAAANPGLEDYMIRVNAAAAAATAAAAAAAAGAASTGGDADSFRPQRYAPLRLSSGPLKFEFYERFKWVFV